MLTIIDETVILRYLLNDHKQQSRQAAEVISTGHAYTYPEIIARVVVTLRDLYNVPRSVIGNAVVQLLDDVCVAEEPTVRLAVRYFGSTPLDFTDCMLVARNVQEGHKVMSFDKAIMKRMLQ